MDYSFLFLPFTGGLLAVGLHWGSLVGRLQIT